MFMSVSVSYVDVGVGFCVCVYVCLCLCACLRQCFVFRHVLFVIYTVCVCLWVCPCARAHACVYVCNVTCCVCVCVCVFKMTCCVCVCACVFKVTCYVLCESDRTYINTMFSLFFFKSNVQPFHNFRHGFSVMQTAYLLVRYVRVCYACYLPVCMCSICAISN